ncbi:unnamed protein product, partial [Brassica oleracea]
LEKAQHGLAHSYSRSKVTPNGTREDTMVIQTYVIGEIVFFLLPCNWFPPPSTQPIQTFLLCPLLSSSHEAATTSVHAGMNQTHCSNLA